MGWISHETAKRWGGAYSVLKCMRSWEMQKMGIISSPLGRIECFPSIAHQPSSIILTRSPTRKASNVLGFCHAVFRTCRSGTLRSSARQCPRRLSSAILRDVKVVDFANGWSRPSRDRARVRVGQVATRGKSMTRRFRPFSNSCDG